MAASLLAEVMADPGFGMIRGLLIAKEQMALLYQLAGPERKTVESLWQFNRGLGKILFFLTSLMLKRFPWYLHLKCQHSW